jgi:uncharacterized protein (TIGR01244 family)
MPARLIKVTDDLWVAPQIQPGDLPEIARLGARMVVNNRPDFEEPGQPTGPDMAEAARAAGLAYAAVPVRGRPTPEQAEEMNAAVEEAGGPVVAYCRSGMRSIATWALGQAVSGKRTREELIRLAADAGYDLSALL